MFQKMLREDGSGGLNSYLVDAENKKCEFWQKDSLAVPLFSRNVTIQKLDYIYSNPPGEHWSLAKDPNDYKYSSARFYNLNERNFSFLKHLWDVI